MFCLLIWIFAWSEVLFDEISLTREESFDPCFSVLGRIVWEFNVSNIDSFSNLESPEKKKSDYSFCFSKFDLKPTPNCNDLYLYYNVQSKLKFYYLIVHLIKITLKIKYFIEKKFYSDRKIVQNFHFLLFVLWLKYNYCVTVCTLTFTGSKKETQKSDLKLYLFLNIDSIFRYLWCGFLWDCLKKAILIGRFNC